MKGECEVRQTNKAAVAYVGKRLSKNEQAQRMAAIFKTLSDPTRIRMIEALSLKELCVCDLACVIGLSQSATSHQLRILRQAGVVRYRKEGKSCFYRLDDEHVADLLKAVALHASHTARGR